MSSGGEAVRLERTFQADIDRVFRAFTDPGELVHWWGPMDVRTSVAQIDLRVGGECRWVMHPSGQVAVLYGVSCRLAVLYTGSSRCARHERHPPAWTSHAAWDVHTPRISA
ncbi:MAG: hypothetical protein K0R13_162 [Propionibacteriaceae bacterium]|nr:hypothetical protein [Propionibacteriaceae bacterium]